MRRTNGRGDDSRDEQQWKWQPGYMRHQSCGGVCHREREYRRGTCESVDTQPFDCHIHQAEPWQTVGTMRMCGGIDRQQLRHHLLDGRRLSASVSFGEEHDSQPHGNDLRRSKTELRSEDLIGRIDGYPVGIALDGGQVCDKCRRHHRRRRR